MSVSFYGDYNVTETVVIPFNAFSSNDPSASITVTDLASTDIYIYKDGSLTQRTSFAGIAVDIDVDGIAGNHWITIDLSDDTDAGFYVAGSRYQARMEGVTIDGATVNAWIGAFSIGCTLRPTTAGRTLTVSANGEGNADVTFIHGSALTETAGQLAGAFTKFFDVAAPTATALSIPDAVPGAANGLLTSVTGSATNTYDGIYAGIVTNAQGTDVATDVAAMIDGSNRVDVGSWLGQAVTLSSGNKPDVNVNEISDDATSADNLELQYDATGLAGDTFPATQAQVGTLSSGSAAVNTTATGTEATTPAVVGTPTNDYTDTTQLNGTYHSWAPSGGGELEFAYNFNIGANASPVSIIWEGYAQTINDVVLVYARNWVGTSWEQIGTINGAVAATNTEETFNLTTAHVNTGANAGDVRIRFVSTGGSIITAFATDRILCGYTITNQSVGYAQGAIWYDDTAANTNTTPYVDGVADNPVSSWAAVKSLISSVGIKRVHIANGSAVTFDAAVTKYSLFGDGWTLALGTQAVGGLHVSGAAVTGVGTAGATLPEFHDCTFGAVTLPPATFKSCGFGAADGLFTAGSDGQFVFDACYSIVAGSGTPDFTFSGLGSATGINNRGWLGGCSYTVDSDCTVSHEVLAGGGQTFISSGADIELRGTCREVTLTLSAGGTTPNINCILLTGPITISGTSASGTTIQLYGVGLNPADTSVNTTVTNSLTNPETITDDWETQSQADPTGFHTNVIEVNGNAILDSSGNLKVVSGDGFALAERRNIPKGR